MILASDSLIGKSLMLAKRIKPSSSNSQFSLPSLRMSSGLAHCLPKLGVARARIEDPDPQREELRRRVSLRL
jgi:hypothetical protein